jgi:type II secretory pathway component HofQ
VQRAAEVLAQFGDRPVAQRGIEGVADERASDEAEATQAPLEREAAVPPGRADLAQLVGALGLRLGVVREVEGVRAEAGAEDGPRRAAEPAGAADDQPVAAGAGGGALRASP